VKRGIFLFLVIVVVVIGIYSVKEWMPIMAVSGTSMYPVLKNGDAILIEEKQASDVAVGDVIVFKVHPLIQETYNYPPMVAHRVIQISEFQGGIAFKTKGDNTNEDPFVVPSSDLRGEVSGQLAYVGHVLLFLQSKQGQTFAILAILLLAFELFANDLDRARKNAQKKIFAPVLEQNETLIKGQQQASKMSAQALEQFAAAMREYAQHLASHTAAVKDLASASHEMLKAIHEQNLMFEKWNKSGFDQPGAATPEADKPLAANAPASQPSGDVPTLDACIKPESET